MRAARVVLDIGVHLEKPRPDGEGTWDADYALAFMRRNVNMPDEFVQFEVNRYLGWPGQAPSYKVGQRIWEQIRDDAKERAGRRLRHQGVPQARARHRRRRPRHPALGADELTQRGSLPRSGRFARQQSRDLLVGRLREVGRRTGRPPRSRGSRCGQTNSSTVAASGLPARPVRPAPRGRSVRRPARAAPGTPPSPSPPSRRRRRRRWRSGRRSGGADAANSRCPPLELDALEVLHGRELLGRHAAPSHGVRVHDLARRPRSRRPRTPRARAHRACGPRPRRGAGRGPEPPRRRPRRRRGGCRTRPRPRRAHASSAAASSPPGVRPDRRRWPRAHDTPRHPSSDMGMRRAASAVRMHVNERKHCDDGRRPGRDRPRPRHFGDVTRTRRASWSATRRRSATSSIRPCSPTRWGCRSSGWGSTTDRSSRSRAPRSCSRPRPPAPSEHPPRHRSDGPLLRRPGARVRAVRHARRRLTRPRRGHPRTRIVHRVVPAVRLRPARLRGALRGEARPLLAAARPRSPSRGRARCARRSTDADVFPKTENGLKAWVGVGGTPESVVRAARYGYGLMLAIIGGPAARFRPFVDLYHRSLDSFGATAAGRRALAGPHRRDRSAGVGRGVRRASSR